MTPRPATLASDAQSSVAPHRADRLARRPGGLARLGVLLLLLALLPLHVLAPFIHAHTEADARAGMQSGLHLPGLEALEDDTRDGPVYGLRHPPLIEEADLGRREAGADPEHAPGLASARVPFAANQRTAPVPGGSPLSAWPPPAPPARAPPPGFSAAA